MKHIIRIAALAAFLAVPSITFAQTKLPAVPAPSAVVPSAKQLPQPTLPTAVPASQPAPVAQIAPVPAYQQAWWQELLVQLILLVGTGVLTLLGGLVTVLLRKYHLETNDQKIHNALDHGIGWVEQWLYQKAKIDGKPTPEAEIVAKAIGKVKEAALEYGLKDKADAWWQDKINAALGLAKRDTAGPTPIKPAA